MLQSFQPFRRYQDLLGRLQLLLAKRRKLVAAVLLLSFVTALVEGLGLSMLYPLLESVVSGTEDEGRVWQALRALAVQVSGNSVVIGLIYLAAGIFFLKALLLCASTAAMTLLLGRLREDWSLAVMRRYLYGPYADILAEPRGKIFQKIKGEPARATKAIEALLVFVIKLIFAAVLTVTLFILNWQLMAVMVVLILVGAVMARRLMYKPVEKLGRKRMTATQTLSARIAEPVFGASVVKLLGVEDHFLKRLTRPWRNLTRANVLITTFSKAPSDFVEFVIVVCVAFVFMVLAYGFGISLQEAVPLIGTFAVISSRLLSVASSLLSKRLNIASVVPSLSLVYRLVSENAARERLEKGATLEKIEGDIEFQEIWFGYDANKPVLKELSLKIPKGKMVGIVGSSGVGKTTLGYLLTRLYESDQGTILINGRDIREFSIESLRRRIGYVEQNPLIFNGTVEENICLGAPDVSKEQIKEAAKAAGAHDFILSLPNGYDTPISDQGATLSGGERQRIAIARAIIRHPDLFIIDEGTSSLDRKTETTVQKSIQRLAAEATVVVIAHRVSTLKDADLIYELLPGGEVVVRTFEEIAA